MAKGAECPSPESAASANIFLHCLSWYLSTTRAKSLPYPIRDSLPHKSAILDHYALRARMKLARKAIKSLTRSIPVGEVDDRAVKRMAGTKTFRALSGGTLVPCNRDIAK